MAFTYIPPFRSPEKTIVVLGSTRGGTSAIAALLRALGVNMGPSLGDNHEDSLFLNSPREHGETILAGIAERNAANALWGFKAPHVIEHIDFYEKALRNPHFVIVWRNPLAVGQSIYKRTGNSVVTGMKHGIKFYTQINDFLEACSNPALFLEYEALTLDKLGEVMQLAEFLGINPTSRQLLVAAEMVGERSGGYQAFNKRLDFLLHMDSQERLAGPGEAVEFAVSGAQAEDGGWFKSTGDDPFFDIDLTRMQRPPDGSLSLSFRFSSRTRSEVSKIYLSPNEKVSERLCKTVRLLEGQNTLVLEPNFLPKRLRIDPTNKPARHFRLDDIRVGAA